ncbi:hypothetical protein QS468_55515 [Bacillus subtilis]|jgi:DNA-binding phage protein|nr:hypothetical protein [Pseudomonas sp. A29(2023)]MDL5602010.1 hypothetical protein [Bacillus subtilis]
MSKRAIHLYPWDGGTEADQDMPDHVYCGTEGDMTDEQLTNDLRHVTCKRCLRILERELAAQAADDRDQKVKLFDEAQAITLDLGHRNLSAAIKALIAENEALRHDVERYRGVRRVANQQGFSDEQFDQQTDTRIANFDASQAKEVTP